MRDLNVLVVGGGGREHVICEKLSESPRLKKLYCAPGNGGTGLLGENIPVKATDIDGIVAKAKEKSIDFAIVASDDPLALGCVDRLEEAGIRAFGPTAAAARIESSKVFAKELMSKYGIPTARWREFSDLEAAREYIGTQKLPVVIKCDGLALGKGVIIAETLEEADCALRDMLENSRFGSSGKRVVIEEFLQGREVTVLAFCDGERVFPMPSSRDHKRAFDGDKGPNTGGMGAVCPVPDYTEEINRRCIEEIFDKTAAAMSAEGVPFKGVLYFGLMLTEEGPKVIEYNARFGDPEAQVVLQLLDGDFLEILLNIYERRLSGISFKEKAAAVVVLASGGYPGEYDKGFPIKGLDALPGGVKAYHAGTEQAGEGGFVTSGGRVLGLTAVGEDLREALDLCYKAADIVYFENMRYRKDVGYETVNQKRF